MPVNSMVNLFWLDEGQDQKRSKIALFYNLIYPFETELCGVMELGRV